MYYNYEYILCISARTSSTRVPSKQHAHAYTLYFLCHLYTHYNTCCWAIFSAMLLLTMILYGITIAQQHCMFAKHIPIPTYIILTCTYTYVPFLCSYLFMYVSWQKVRWILYIVRTFGTAAIANLQKYVLYCHTKCKNLSCVASFIG